MTHWRLILEIAGGFALFCTGMLVGRKNPAIANEVQKVAEAAKAAAKGKK